MNPHQRCLQAKVKYRNERKQVMPKSEDLSRSLEINAIWTFDTEFPTLFNKSGFSENRLRCFYYSVADSTAMHYNREYMYKCMHYKDTCSSSS